MYTVRTGLSLAACLLIGCAFGGRAGPDAAGGADGSAFDASPRDAGGDAMTRDSGRIDAANFDAGGLDSGAPRDSGSGDSGPPDSAGSDAGSLSSDLALPDPSGTPCSTPRSRSECPDIEICRFFTPAEGRCESCSPCGNLFAFCTASSECDILFMCFRNRCTNFCTLGTFECGPIDECIDIGHATMGVCLPP